MTRALPRPLSLPRLSWKAVAVAVYIGVNVGLIAYYWIWPGPHNNDWRLWLALREGPMYEVRVNGVPFVYSPVAGWLLIGLTYLGYWVSLALQVAAVGLLRFSPLLMLLVFTSWGWVGLALHGNPFTFVIVAAALALRGSTAWALVYVALFCMMPRPVQLPLLIYLLWTMPALRWPAVAVVVVHTALAFLSGDLFAWIGATLMLDTTTTGMNLGPTALIGTAWLVIGIPLAAWLTWRGRVGWAGLALSPYILPQYWLMPLVELRRQGPASE